MPWWSAWGVGFALHKLVGRGAGCPGASEGGLGVRFQDSKGLGVWKLRDLGDEDARV